jgi:predicted nucleic acid-binding Zn ribbon protein
VSGGKNQPMKVAEALARYLDRSGLGDRLEQVSALDDWPDRVGERIAAVAEPIHVANDVLFVAVKSSAWLMELRMMEADIRRRLNEGRVKGRIERIRFVQEGDPLPGPDDEDGGPSRRGPPGWRRRGR